MAILIYCLDCNRPFARTHKNCPKCGKNLRKNKKFWVNLPLPNERRRTAVVKDNLTVARKVEASMKKDIINEKHFGIKKAPFIHYVYKKFEKWNKRNLKKSQMSSSRWEVHIEPYILKNKIKKMDDLSIYDINKILDGMKEKGGRKGNGYAPATIKHVVNGQ